MIALENLSDAIDVSTGALRLDLQLASLPDAHGPSFSLSAAYSSAVEPEARRWNLKAPTGILGLGWTLSTEKVVAVPEPGTTSAGLRYFLLRGRSILPLIRLGTEASGVETYGTSSGDFWVIRHDPAARRWTFIDENGIRFTYGDSGSSPDAVETRVAFGDWMGSSIRIEGQRSVPVAWHLSRIDDLWHQAVTLSYTQVKGTVGTGSTTFTRQIYLNEVRGAEGGRLVLVYGDKSAAEYQAPHAQPPMPNAWQDAYETQCLKAIQVVSPGGAVLSVVSFEYAFVGEASLIKRLLIGVEAAPPAGRHPPALRFEYARQPDSLDYGRLNRVVTPDGGIAEVTYTKLSPGLSHRTTPLTPPNDRPYMAPELTFGDDFVVAVYRAVDKTAVTLVTHTWEGRWVSAPLDSVAQPNSQGIVSVAVADQSFAAILDHELRAYRRDPRCAGAWTSLETPVEIGTSSGNVAVACTNDMAAALVLDTATLSATCWNGSAWLPRQPEVLPGGGAGPMAAMSSDRNRAIAVVTDRSNPSAPFTIHIFGVDATSAWYHRSGVAARSLAHIDKLAVWTGASFAVVRSSGPSDGGRAVSFMLVDWSSPEDPVRCTPLAELFLGAAEALPEPAIHGASVAIGEILVRYDGTAWVEQYLGGSRPKGASAVRELSAGTDLLVRTFTKAGGGLVMDIVAYDPNAPSGSAWKSMQNADVPTINCAARAAIVRNISSDYVIFGKASGPGRSVNLFHRDQDGRFKSVFTLSDTLTEAELSSLQVVGERYLVYQRGGEVVIYPLANGTAAATACTRLTGAKVLVPGAKPTCLLGPHCVATYAGTWGNGVAVSLHRVTDTGADGAAAVAAVASIRSKPGNTSDTTTGYAVIDTIATYTASSAIGSFDGTAAHQQRVAIALGPGGSATAGSVVIEMYNGLTDAEATRLPSADRPNYPSGAVTNASNYTRLLMGQVYRSTTARSGQAADVETRLLEVTERCFLSSGSYRPVGFYARPRRVDTQIDGVSVSVETTYGPTGFPSEVTTYRYNTDGQRETVTVALTYFPWAYGTAGPENLLSPVIQTLTRTNGALTGGTATTWSASWGAAKAAWAPSSTYRPVGGSAGNFSAWNDDSVPSGWQRTSRVTMRTSTTGAIIAAQDVLRRSAVHLHDRAEARVVARFENAAPGEVSYCGFEPYERSAPWAYQGDNLLAHITTAQAHTGTRSLSIASSAASAPKGPIVTLLRTTVDKPFLFSCWALVPEGFTPDPQKARWTLQVYAVEDPPRPVGTAIGLPFPAPAGGAWQYLQAIVDLGDIRKAVRIGPNVPLSVTISASNTIPGSTATIFVDELRFAPLASSFSAVVFDAATGLVSATLSENGTTYRQIRDTAQRVVATVGPTDDRGVAMVTSAYARDLSGIDAFRPELPNQVLTVRSASFGGYHSFSAAEAVHWKLPAGWIMAEHRLSFAGSSGDALGSHAQLKDFVHSHYAARVRVETTKSVVSIGTGAVFVSWIPAGNSGSFQLRRANGDVLAEHNSDFLGDWLFAVVDQVAFFFADGRQLFAYPLENSDASAGNLVLAATSAASFEGLVVAIDPQLSVHFLDGAGTPILKTALVDRQTVLVNGVLFDALGRPSVTREPLTMPIAISSSTGAMSAADPAPIVPYKTEGALTTYLRGAGGQAMTIAQYLDPAISDAPFSQVVFEGWPQERPVEIGAPGAQFAMGSGHTLRFAYGASAAGGWLSRVMSSGAPGQQAGSYFMTTITTPNGMRIERAMNQAGQLIAEALTSAGKSDPVSITSYHYDAAGNHIETRLPNYYAPPEGSLASTWTLHATYDFVGRITSIVGPSIGTERFLADSAGQPRFMMTAADTEKSPQRIRYVRYDALGRPVERGILRSGIAWNNLANHVDDLDWPSDADGALWIHRYAYDRSLANGAQPRNLVGRLWQVTVNRSENATLSAADVDTYEYAYDAAGNVIQQDTHVPAFDDVKRRSVFDWNNLGQLVRIAYPQTLDAAGVPQEKPVEVTYFYDRIGRLVGIGNAPEGTEVVNPDDSNANPMGRYARYAYGASGLLDAVTLGLGSGGEIERRFSYDTGGRLTQLGGDYFSQALTYGQGGLGGETDWEGRVTSSTLTYTRHRGATDDLASGPLGTRTWRYAYDAAGRLTAAVASDESSALSIGSASASERITFDANGTLLEVPRPPVQERYAYPGKGLARTGDSIQMVTSSIQQTDAFANGKLALGWTTGASNGGASSSAFLEPKVGEAPTLRLQGGGEGYYEFLRFSGALSVQQKYTLSYRFRAPSPFGSQAGRAGWYLILRSAEGEAYRACIEDLSAGQESATDRLISLDLPAAARAAGLAGKVVAVELELINGKRGENGAIGAPLDLSALSLTTDDASHLEPSRYDASGRLIEAPARALKSVAYDALHGFVAKVELEPGQPFESIAHRHDPTDRVGFTIEKRADGSEHKMLHLRAPGGELLATMTRKASGGIDRTLHLLGPDGAIGYLPPDSTWVRYELRDHLGSVRAVVKEGDDKDEKLVQRFDYGPFGEFLLAEGQAVEGGARFTDQPLDAATGLYSFPARAYDPALRAFISPDAAMETPWSYAYVAGDPINRVDPSGNSSRRAFQTALLVVTLENLCEMDPYDLAWKMAASVVAGHINRLIFKGTNFVWSPLMHLANWVFHKFVDFPIMSMTADFVSSVAHHATYTALDTTVQSLRFGGINGFCLAEIANATRRGATDAVLPSILWTIYRHYVAPPFAFPRYVNGRLTLLRGEQDGPRYVTVGDNERLFLTAEGTFAFEDHAVGAATIPYRQLAGNVNTARDANTAIAQMWPIQFYLQGLRYSPALTTQGYVLEHRLYPGYVLMVPTNIHTPGLGGPDHIGGTALLNGYARWPWWMATQLGEASWNICIQYLYS